MIGEGQLTIEQYFALGREACVTGIEETYTQCCYCCGDLGEYVEGISADVVDYCRIGCLGYLNFTCEIANTPSNPNNALNLAYCSYGNNFASKIPLELNGGVLNCNSEGELVLSSLPTASPTRGDSSTSSLGISSGLATAFLVGAVFLILFAIGMLAISVHLVNRSRKREEIIMKKAAALANNEDGISTYLEDDLKTTYNSIQRSLPIVQKQV